VLRVGRIAGKDEQLPAEPLGCMIGVQATPARWDQLDDVPELILRPRIGGIDRLGLALAVPPSASSRSYCGRRNSSSRKRSIACNSEPSDWLDDFHVSRQHQRCRRSGI
jgi:hypothetical protein